MTLIVWIGIVIPPPFTWDAAGFILIPITSGWTLYNTNHTYPHPNHVMIYTLQQESLILIPITSRGTLCNRNNTHLHPNHFRMDTLQQESHSSSPITSGWTIYNMNHTHPHPYHLRMDTLQQQSHSSSSQWPQNEHSAKGITLILIPITVGYTIYNRNISRKLCIVHKPIRGLPHYNPILYWSKFSKGVKQ